MDLLKRRPRFHFRAKKSLIIYSPEQYPQFSEQFRVLDRVLMPIFSQYDSKAQVEQNKYWGFAVLFILGSICSGSLGILEQHIPFAGLLEATLTFVLGVMSLTTDNGHQEIYMKARLVAESLRATFFWFLSPESNADEVELQKRIKAITRNKRTETQAPKAAIKKTVITRQAFFKLYEEEQLKGQISFYRSRIKEFKTAQKQAKILATCLMFLSSVASTMVEFAPFPLLHSIAVLVAGIAPILATGVLAYSELYSYGEQAEIYESTLQNLEEILEDFEVDPTMDLVEEINQMFEMERGKWGSLPRKTFQKVE